MADITQRAMLGLLGAGAVGVAASWPRLTASDIPGRHSEARNIAILAGTSK